MNRNDAIDLARAHALAHGQDHAYLPTTDAEAAEWLPHSWVVDAIVAAFGAGHCPVDRPVRPVSEACRTCGLLLAPWLRLYCTKCVQQHLKG
mgnify:CR=1 FL=1